MTTDNWLSILFLLAALVLPVSALAGRRLNWSKGLVMALIWGTIFLAVAAFITAVRG